VKVDEEKCENLVALRVAFAWVVLRSRCLSRSVFQVVASLSGACLRLCICRNMFWDLDGLVVCVGVFVFGWVGLWFLPML
jgi:hypothetical protein